MRKKRWLALYVGGPALLGTLAAIGNSWMAKPTPAVSIENAERIRLGMTLNEVAEILGGPPGDYGPGEAIPFESNLRGDRDYLGAERTWLVGNQGIAVNFDRKGKVLSVRALLDVQRHRLTILDKIRAWWLE